VTKKARFLATSPTDIMTQPATAFAAIDIRARIYDEQSKPASSPTTVLRVEISMGDATDPSNRDTSVSIGTDKTVAGRS